MVIEPLVCPHAISGAVAATDSIGLGCAIPEPCELAQPFTVCVTVKVPAAFTIIEASVSLVFHNKVPAAVADKVEVPSQLFTAVTTGAGGVNGCAFITAVVTGEIQPSAFFIVTL